MSDLHIDDFYRDAAKILAALYHHFPRTMTLYVEDISGEDTPDEFGLHSPRHEACFHTMLWLGSTGYLKYGQTVTQEGIDEAVLSHRALLLLNSAAPQPDTKHSHTAIPLPGELVIHKIREQLKAGTSDSLGQFIQLAMRAF